MEASKALTTLNASQSEMIQSLTKLLSYVSIFVSVVLAFLILYANNFLVRRRKKELGLYMTLGMSKYRISQILVVETFFVGLLSLIAGLLLGIVLSQGLAALTVSMFDANITQFKFVFSSDAMLKTIIYFGIIFLFVMIFNSIIISRYKLIDLLLASRKNERLKIRKTSTSMILFILSLLILGLSYGIVMKYGLFRSEKLLVSVGLGSLGTLLLFMSLSGFLLMLIQRNKKIYFKDINMFVLRQINSKVNTTFFSMTIICLMLFFTIGVLSTGFSYKVSMEKNVGEYTPYDASLSMYVEGSKYKSVDQTAKVLGLDLKTFGEIHSFNLYSSNVLVKELWAPYQSDEAKEYIQSSGGKKISIMKKSDFDQILAMRGKDPISLHDDEIVLLSTFPLYKDTFNHLLNVQSRLTMNGKQYRFAGHKVFNMGFKTEMYSEEVVTIVVPDEVVIHQKPLLSVVNINYKENQAKQSAQEEELNQIHENMIKNKYKQDDIRLNIVTKTMIQDASIGSSTMIVFIGIYVGIVFLISSAAVLALQQLSEASDNLERYHVLKKIGVTKQNLNKAIFWQIFIYFMMPLALAIVHSVFGIQVVNKAIMTVGETSVLIPSFITTLIMIFVYGGYFLATYTGYKNIVK